MFDNHFIKKRIHPCHHLRPAFSGTTGLIDPKTIKAKTILKDASATSIYGLRGAVGVIIITIKDTDRKSEYKRLKPYLEKPQPQLRPAHHTLLTNSGLYCRNYYGHSAQGSPKKIQLFAPSSKINSAIRPILKAVRRGFSCVGIIPLFLVQRFARPCVSLSKQSQKHYIKI
jgi:TonB-dependent SusC/RagA subfamily outer membrane receptor